VERWERDLERVAIALLEAFALSLGLPADAFSPIYREAPNHRLKVIRYPGRDVAADD